MNKKEASQYTDHGFPSKLGRSLINYAKDLDSFASPQEVLDELDNITSDNLNLSLHLAARFPQRVTDWNSLVPGKTVFLHGEMPRAWWEEWVRHLADKYPVGYALARISLAPYTWREALNTLQPLAIDHWDFELALKYGAQDGYTCPVGGRWAVSFWAKRPLSETLSQPVRIILFAAASFAAMRLEQLVQPNLPGGRLRAMVTPRELSVLRLLSIGTPFREVAQSLGVGEETVRTHLKKVQAKLGARNRTQAVAEAIRQQLIP